MENDNNQSSAAVLKLFGLSATSLLYRGTERKNNIIFYAEERRQKSTTSTDASLPWDLRYKEMGNNNVII